MLACAHDAYDQPPNTECNDFKRTGTYYTGTLRFNAWINDTICWPCRQTENARKRDWRQRRARGEDVGPLRDYMQWPEAIELTD